MDGLQAALVGCSMASLFIGLFNAMWQDLREQREKRRLTNHALKAEPAKKELPKKCSHPESALVDIRSDVFSPKELVATLCTACDEQLGPEVWQKILDRELAALDEPPVSVGWPSRSMREYLDDGWRLAIEASKQLTLRNEKGCEATIYFDDRDHLKAFAHGEELGIEGPVKHSVKCSAYRKPRKPKTSSTFVEDTYIPVQPKFDDFQQALRREQECLTKMISGMLPAGAMIQPDPDRELGPR